jgi:hypothetical protein
LFGCCDFGLSAACLPELPALPGMRGLYAISVPCDRNRTEPLFLLVFPDAEPSLSDNQSGRFLRGMAKRKQRVETRRGNSPKRILRLQALNVLLLAGCVTPCAPG